MSITLNCDMGEGIGNDALLMPYIHAANIACGFHAGDASTMWHTVEMAVKHSVAVGAHPSFHDPNNFGRTELNLPREEVYEMMIQQLLLLNDVTNAFGIKLNHVKPHGALYNMSAKDPQLAETIALAVKDFNDQLILFGLSNSISIQKAEELGLQTANEVFADRTYQEDGSLTPRSRPGALIEDVDKAVAQVLQMIHTGTVTAVTGKSIPITVDTICIHGDGQHAVAFARKIHAEIEKERRLL